ncbi:hypothetical protein BC739_004026 [Kutzneria viridogrisea]|uniref:Uncharacterized protein n=1 Tax=Kutzneria viridogrisea TaxID=47990 RepID=A0ABR6BJA6_9PSEU|nr:hypothetical protein [Kutzneria viridogrisea]
MSDDHDESADAAPGTDAHRAGEWWIYADYQLLADGLTEGLDETELARRLGRTIDAVRSRLPWLVDPDAAVPSTQALDWLRAAFDDDEHYNWPGALREHHARKNRPYFDHRADRALHQAWDARQPMPQLVAALGIDDDLVIAQHLMALGLAGTALEIAGWLGTVPGGRLERRVRLMRERAGTAVWILVADGLATGRHISVHDTQDDAQQAVTELLQQHRHPDTTVSQLTWTIAERMLGCGATGPTWHDKLLPLQAYPGD